LLLKVHWDGGPAKSFLLLLMKVKKAMVIICLKTDIFPCLFQFDTYIKNAYVDDKPCLALDYRAYRTLAFGLVDEVRKIRDGQVLGRAYNKFPWKKQMWFIGYFVLCPLNKECVV